MHSFFALSTILPLFLRLSILNRVAASPKALCNTIASAKPEGRGCATSPWWAIKTSSPPSTEALLLGLATGPNLPDPFNYRIPRTTKSITFSLWGRELPNFDDVIILLDTAEAELENELRHSSGDEPIQKERNWKFQTARLLVINPADAAGLNHHQASQADADCVGLKGFNTPFQLREKTYRREYFYIGGRYVTYPILAGNLTHDQLYVEKLIPAAGVKQPHPLVFFHGGGLAGNVRLQPPDNRKGWASYFLDLGYAVYIIDQTSVGRANERDIPGYPLRIRSTAKIAERGFTAPEIANDYPQSQLHIQWPGASRFSNATYAIEYRAIQRRSVLEHKPLRTEALPACRIRLIPFSIIFHSC
ncbi:MAG: hypothetical protein Q9184_007584 [Pyrenodesmia sp. 2 TL-2023]